MKTKILFLLALLASTSITANQSDCPKKLAGLCMQDQFIVFERSDVRCMSIEKNTLDLGLTKQAGNKLHTFTKNNLEKLLATIFYNNKLIFASEDITKYDVEDLANHVEVLSLATIKSPLGDQFRIANLSEDAIAHMQKAFSVSSCGS